VFTIIDIIQITARELGLSQKSVASTVKMLDEGNTVPFIARYRKEMTGELDETQIRQIEERVGHAMHFYYSGQEQPFIYSAPAIFTAEVASTVHESLLMEYLLQTVTEQDKRYYLINYYLEMFRTTLFRQTMFAEFETIIHDQAEKGETLTSHFLKETYHQLNTDYHGEDMVVDREIDYEWARIPHFYDAFYVYKYATGMSAAVSLVKQILTKGKPAVEKYLSFLQKGGSDYPLNLLREAGVDMTSPQPVQDAINRFSSLLDELI
jgi:oligoendopeptidase F